MQVKMAERLVCQVGGLKDYYLELIDKKMVRQLLSPSSSPCNVFKKEPVKKPTWQGVVRPFEVYEVVVAVDKASREVEQFLCGL